MRAREQRLGHGRYPLEGRRQLPPPDALHELR